MTRSVTIAQVDQETKRWAKEEEEYLDELHKVSTEFSNYFQLLYEKSYHRQTTLRLPAILMSSLTGVASFGSTTFPLEYQKYVSIGSGIINICIAMLQTYESYLKIGDTVTQSLRASEALRKLADDIHCELYIPITDRSSHGVVFLRESFARYQAIMEQGPAVNQDIIRDKGIKGIHKIIQRRVQIEEEELEELRSGTPKGFARFTNLMSPRVTTIRSPANLEKGLNNRTTEDLNFDSFKNQGRFHNNNVTSLIRELKGESFASLDVYDTTNEIKKRESNLKKENSGDQINIKI